jgi:glycosyltransferase involved in cell wall biosynthesis
VDKSKSNQLVFWVFMKKVIICQYRLLHYRTKLFELLKARCLSQEIDLHIVYGQASRREAPKKDEALITSDPFHQWTHKVDNTFWAVGEKDAVWQPLPKNMLDASLVIVMQESRILSNYLLLIKRFFSKVKIAYWGHGINCQSQNPSGIREKWKELMLNKVDWWFAYTQSTCSILEEAQYPSERTTCLNNAIDTTGFKSDLSNIDDYEIEDAKEKLNISENDMVAIFCGSLYPDKKLDLLVSCSDIIRNKYSNFSLLVIGDGPSMPELQQAAQTRPWLHILGVRKGKEKALYFRLAHIMLNPGLVGLHIVDAFCAGLVLCTTASAKHSPEIAYLRNGENGLITADAADAYSSAILELISQPELLAAMQTKALADSEVYTLDNMVENFAAGIAQCLAADKKCLL